MDDERLVYLLLIFMCIFLVMAICTANECDKLSEELKLIKTNLCEPCKEKFHKCVNCGDFDEIRTPSNKRTSE